MAARRSGPLRSYCRWQCRHLRKASRSRQYGGTLEIGTVYVTLSALSFDPADWNWKLNHDTGNYLEQLFAADLSKSRRNGGKYPFYADAYLPSDAIRGELAESWEWKKDPLRVEVRLRKGIMFPDKPGVMTVARADRGGRRVRYYRLATSPKASGYFDLCRQGGGHRPATPSSSISTTFHAEWDYRFGWGYYSPIYPEGNGRRRRHQLEERQRHRTVHAHRLRAGQFQHLLEEPDLLGQGEDQRQPSTSCRSSTRSSIAPSRMRPHSSPRCEPASSTSSRPSGGRRSMS